MSSEKLSLIDVERSILLLGATTAHSDIIKRYQNEITTLTNNIILASKVALENVTLVTASIKNKVDTSANTLAQDIALTKSVISTQLSKPIASNSTVKSCLNLQNIYAQSLSTTALKACNDADRIAALKDLQSDLLLLKAPVSTLGETCRQLHPLASDGDGMEECLSFNITYYNQLLIEATNGFSEEAGAVESDADACILNEENSITSQTSDICTKALKCTGINI